MYFCPVSRQIANRLRVTEGLLASVRVGIIQQPAIHPSPKRLGWRIRLEGQVFC
jgi:hypothetical protein